MHSTPSPFPWRPFTLATGALLSVWMFAAACQSTRPVSAMNAATGTQETIELLEGGVATIAARRRTAQPGRLGTAPT